MEPNPDFQEERDPHSVDGGMANALLADDAVCNMTEAGHHCPVHGIEECWGATPMMGMEEAVVDPEHGQGNHPDDSEGGSIDEEGFGLNPTPSAMEEKSPLAGIYGHSGKMKEVGKDTSFLDRLKELSGMARS